MSDEEKPALPHLKPQYMLFVAAYSVDFKGREAAIAAGYKPKYADAQAWKLLQRADIQVHLAYRQAKKIDELGVSATEVIGMFANVMRGNLADFINVQGKIVLPIGSNGEDLDRNKLAILSEYSVDTVGMIGSGENAVPIMRTKIKMKDSLAAAEKLARILGLFREKMLPLSGEGDAPNGPRDETFRDIAQKLVFALRFAMSEAGASKPDEEKPAPLH